MINCTHTYKSLHNLHLTAIFQVIVAYTQLTRFPSVFFVHFLHKLLATLVFYDFCNYNYYYYCFTAIQLLYRSICVSYPPVTHTHTFSPGQPG